MPVEIIYESNPSGVVARCSEKITGSEFLAANEELVKCQSCTFQIHDFLQASQFDISMDELHRVAIQDRFINKNHALEKMAVVDKENLVQDVYNTFEFFSLTWVGRYKPFVSKFFNNMHEARSWIKSLD